MINIKDRDILKIINNIMKEFDIIVYDMNTNLSDIGMNSISFIKMIVDFEEKFQCEIPVEKLIISEMNTPQKIKSAILSIVNT